MKTDQRPDDLPFLFNQANHIGIGVIRFSIKFSTKLGFAITLYNRHVPRSVILNEEWLVVSDKLSKQAHYKQQ
ncbi:Uncharacterised protein [Vibrio cholerae]|uniref:Uncharacterized protein n=1 Tax=Vibrio cholerae TaxID=666 RepID=A0A655Z296_VIBCL|nr:Uncharacterised protein [Vibrio cholerae]CSC01964.1 Uncharacterised protein [Vibrio cholerae]CSC56699.1 Uncharacterised protein [Vibrio cholerae]CSC93529.1 Uncharacterised protein [Vibrio cholerae]